MQLNSCTHLLHRNTVSVHHHCIPYYTVKYLTYCKTLMELRRCARNKKQHALEKRYREIVVPFLIFECAVHHYVSIQLKE
jgi:hypothetical protein